MSFDLHPILDADVSPRPGIWYAVAPEGAAPAARVGAAAVQAREIGTVYLCAGATPDDLFSDLHELKVGSNSITWNTLPSPSLPPRYEHTLVLTQDGRLLAFAGAQETGPLNDMWKYDSESGDWRVVQATSGLPPSPRTHHCASCMWRGDKLIVFSGGHSSTGTVDNSVHVFDTTASSWDCPVTSGNPPPPRQGHISAVVGDTLFVHGGLIAGGEIYSDLYTLDLEKMHWCEQKPSGSAPPPLAAHGCAIIGTRLYIFGGLTTSCACDTLHCLDTEVLQWSQVKVEGALPPSRLDLAMSTICLPLSHASDETTDASVSPPPPPTPSQAPLTPHHASQPHLVTVIDPTTAESPTQTGCDARSSELPSAISEGHDVEENGQKEDDSVSDKGSEDVSSVQAQSDGANPSLHEASSAAVETNPGKGGLASNGLKEMVTVNGREAVTGLLVFGGMDTSGHVHSDCFIIVPP